MTISVVLADDQEMVRSGFAMILSQASDIEVVGQAGDGVTAVDLIRTLRPDVALLDIRMPRLDGLDVARLVAELTRVVIVTTFGEDDYVDRALSLGAVGFLLKDSGPALLLAAVRAAASGDAMISPELTLPLLRRTRVTNTKAADAAIKDLSPRELEVVQLVARGRTNAEIADELVLSLATVKTHLANVSARLAARNRVEIAARAWASGLLD